MRNVAAETRGESFSRPVDSVVFKGHQMRICLQLQANVELNISFARVVDHRIAQIVVRRAKTEGVVSAYGASILARPNIALPGRLPEDTERN